MKKSRVGPIMRLTVSAACIVMGILSGTGVVQSTVPNGKLIFGIGWLVVGAGWLVRYYLGRFLEANKPDEDGSDGSRAP